MYIKLLLFIVLLFSAACGQTNQDKTHEEAEETTLEPVEVQINLPGQIEVRSEVEFQAVVTQGEEAVTDADKVEFEIWQEGAKDSSQMIAAEHKGEGHYTILTSFDTEGSYVVQSHVTARDMHVMPQAPFTVGSSDSSGEEPSSENNTDSDTGHHH